MDGFGFYMCKWEIGFNPLKHQLTYIQDWYKIPKLPYEFWHKNILAKIGDKLGKYVCTEEWMDEDGISTYVQIYVEISPSFPRWKEM